MFYTFLATFVSFFDIFENQTTKNNNHLKKNYFILLFGLLIYSQNNYCQSDNEVQTYNWFDNKPGKESLEFRTGVGHLNFDHTIDDQHRYYNTNEFKNGSIVYNGQNYYNIDLKYDIFADVLVAKPYPETPRIQINLVKEKMNSFKIENEKFVNLTQINSTFRGGYYEETIIKNDCILYIKYLKEQKVVVKDNFLLTGYTPHCEFLLLKDDKFVSINTKSEILELYPKQKRKINDFYFMNKDLKKQNPGLFMKNLMKYINNFNL